MAKCRSRWTLQLLQAGRFFSSTISLVTLRWCCAYHLGYRDQWWPSTPPPFARIPSNYGLRQHVRGHWGTWLFGSFRHWCRLQPVYYNPMSGLIGEKQIRSFYWQSLNLPHSSSVVQQFLARNCKLQYGGKFYSKFLTSIDQISGSTICLRWRPNVDIAKVKFQETVVPQANGW